MSITSKIIRIQTNIADAYDAAEAKGATLPTTKNSENLPNTIASITTGDGAGGDSITYTNITGATIAKDNKLWINTTATTTEKQYDFRGIFDNNPQVIYMTSNPNIGISSTSNGGLVLVNFTDTGFTGQHIADSLRSGQFNIMVIDKENYFLSLDSNSCVCIYNIDTQSVQYYSTGRVSRYVMGCNYIATRASEYGDHIIIKTNPATGEILKTYTAAESQYETVNRCGYEMNGTVYAVYNWYGYKIGKVVFDDSALTYTIENSVAMSKDYILGGISDANLLFVGSFNVSDSKKLYDFEILSADTLEKVDSTTLPEVMQQCLNNPTVLFINDYSSLFTAYIPNLKKFVILQYVNGQWVDKSPIITAEDFSQSNGLNLAGFSSSADFSRMIYPTTSTKEYTYSAYSGNEKSGGYYAVPYLYSRKETFTAKADEECVNNATSTASAYLPASKIIPPISGGPAGSTPVIIPPSELKFGDRIDNKATVVGTYNSKDLGTVVYAVLDAQYRGADIAWASGLFGIDTGLPNYSVVQEEQNPESATYNTDYIINNYSDKATEAFTFCRNIEPLTYNGNSYNCQLPNGNELLEICNKKAELDTLDPTAEINSTNKLSNWGFGCDYVWWSNEDCSYNAMGLHPTGSWETPLKNSAKGGVCPIIEIPINTGVEIDVSNSEYTYSDGNLVLTKYTGTSQDVTIPNPFYKG